MTGEEAIAIIAKTEAHINWLDSMNTQVRLANPKERHEGYEMAINDVRRFINMEKRKTTNENNT